MSDLRTTRASEASSASSLPAGETRSEATQRGRQSISVAPISDFRSGRASTVQPITEDREPKTAAFCALPGISREVDLRHPMSDLRTTRASEASSASSLLAGETRSEASSASSLLAGETRSEATQRGPCGPLQGESMPTPSGKPLLPSLPCRASPPPGRNAKPGATRPSSIRSRVGNRMTDIGNRSNLSALPGISPSGEKRE